MKTDISAELLAHYASGRKTLATMWKCTRRNGTVVYATSHTEDLEYPVGSGITYLATAAYQPTDIETSSDLSVDNLELEGFLRSPGVTEADLHSGVWDYAQIEWFEVNYADLTMGRNLIRKGTLGELQGNLAKFRAELRGLTQALSRRIVRLITKECPWTLGDSRCTKDLTAFRTTGYAASVTNRRVFIGDAAISAVADYYTAGTVEWTSGANNGIRMEIKRGEVSRTITLVQAMPFDIAVNDTFTITAGCLKRFTEDCVGKYDNGVNHGGFPNLPQSDVYKEGS